MKNLFTKLSLRAKSRSHKQKILFIFLLSICSIYGQEKKQDSTKTEKLDEVLVRAVRVDAKSPITHSNVTKKEITKRNLGQDIPILLNFLPSVVTTTDAGAGVGYTGIRVRGVSPQSTNITINGIPYNDAESLGTFWVNLGDFASSVESLQLQRGVGTSTNGSGAFGASINVLTDAVSKKASGEISNSFGSFNTRKHTVKFSTGLMNDHFEIVGISSPGNKLDIVKEREGIVIYPLRMQRGISIFSDMVSIVKLMFLLMKLNPGIVHTHSPKAGLLGMVAAYVARVDVRLHTVAGMPLESRQGWRKKLLLKMEKLTYSCAHFVLPNSYSLKDFIVDNRLCADKKLKVIGNGSSNGIDINHFTGTKELDIQAAELRNSLNIAKETIVYGFLGRLVKDKGINELIHAFKKLKENNTQQVVLLLAGKFEDHLDPLEPDVRQYIDESEAIHFLGYLSDVRPFLLTIDCFVFPSHREGFPGALMQAAAMNCSIITTRATGCRDIISNATGIVVDINDMQALYNGMKQNQNAEFRALKSIHVREFVVKNFSRDFVWESLRKEYESLINASK